MFYLGKFGLSKLVPFLQIFSCFDYLKIPRNMQATNRFTAQWYNMIYVSFASCNL